MAFNKLLACVSSARTADIAAIPTVAATAKTVAHVLTFLVIFLTAYGISSSALGQWRPSAPSMGVVEKSPPIIAAFLCHPYPAMRFAPGCTPVVDAKALGFTDDA